MKLSTGYSCVIGMIMCLVFVLALGIPEGHNMYGPHPTLSMIFLLLGILFGVIFVNEGQGL